MRALALAALNAMVLTASTMLPLGTELPLDLIDRQRGEGVGDPFDPAALAGRPVLVLFLCPHCPFVKHIEPELSRLQADFAAQVALLGVCSNSSLTHPQDGLKGMAAQAEARGWTLAARHISGARFTRQPAAECDGGLIVIALAAQPLRTRPGPAFGGP